MTTLSSYDPDNTPDREAWLALDEQGRDGLVAEYHRAHRIDIPKSGRKMHAMIHAVAETQLAKDDVPEVHAALERMLAVGATRHDAVHAIGVVLTRYFLALVRGEASEAGDHAALREAIDRLGRTPIPGVQQG